MSKNKMHKCVYNFKSGLNEFELPNMIQNVNNEINVDVHENEDFYKYINKSEKITNDVEDWDNDMSNKKNYFYRALDMLNKEEPLYSNTINIFICAFHINAKEKYPFIQFAMKKFDTLLFEDMVTLPCFSYFGKGSIIDDSISKLDELFAYEKMHKKEVTYKYEGYIVEEEDLYIFFDISNLNIETMELCRNDALWFVMVDEIVNYKHVCNFPIHNNVVDFFLRNNEFLLLQDDDNNNIQSPIICYKGVHESRLKFTSIFGVSKSENDAIVGPYYYFTTYEKAIEQGGWAPNKKEEFRHSKKITENNNGKYDKGGIIRFAVFLGRLKVPLNYPEDEIDSSPYKKEILADIDAGERDTMRVTDYDGKWAEMYDSIYIGNLELDNGNKLMDAPYWVVKDYKQQVPLSFHYIDNTTLGNIFEKKSDYYIK